MIDDDPGILDRLAPLFPTPEDSFEGCVRRRDRKRRNRRVSAAAVALAVSAIAIGVMLKAFEGSHTVPATPITPSTVGNLRPAWTAHLDGPPLGQPGLGDYGHETIEPLPPAAADGKVFVSTNAGSVYAFPESCSAECAPIWTARAGGSIKYTPTVADGLVFVSTDNGRLIAIRTDCGAGDSICSPEWYGRLGGRMLSSPVVVGGIVYGIVDTGEAIAFREHCRTDGSVCDPLWTSPLKPIGPHPAPAVSRPTVSGGVVYVGDPSGDRVTALDARTGRRLWYGLGVGNPSAFGVQVAGMMAPSVDGGLVIESLQDGVVAFASHCRGDGKLCRPRWFAASGALGASCCLGPQAVAGGRVYVVGFHVIAEPILNSLKENCGKAGAECRPTWQSDLYPFQTDPLVVNGDRIFAASSDSPAKVFTASCPKAQQHDCQGIQLMNGFRTNYAPTVVGGVVFMGSPDGFEFAFAADCADLCQPAWKTGPLGSAVSSPLVDGSSIFVTASDGTLRAFKVNPNAAAEGSSMPEAGLPIWAIVVIGVAIALLFGGWALLRRRSHVVDPTTDRPAWRPIP